MPQPQLKNMTPQHVDRVRMRLLATLPRNPVVKIVPPFMQTMALSQGTTFVSNASAEELQEFRDGCAAFVAEFDAAIAEGA